MVRLQHAYSFILVMHIKLQIKIKSSLYSLYCAETFNEFTGPITSLRVAGNIALYEKISQRWRAVGNSLSNLTGPRFEPQTYLLQRRMRYYSINWPRLPSFTPYLGNVFFLFITSFFYLSSWHAVKILTKRASFSRLQRQALNFKFLLKSQGSAEKE